MRILVIALWLVSATATAAPDPKAAAHYKQGKVFLDSKQYDQAIVEFEAAYAIDKVASHLFNIAKAYDAKGDPDKAIEYYQKYLDAEPTSPRAAEVRSAIAIATQARDDQRAKTKLEQQKVLATGHVKQADAYAQAGAWVDAGNEHRAAFTIDGDPAHLLAAAEAFRKAPDLKATRDAYIAYLGKVPQGGESDAVRAKLAATQKAIEKTEDDERMRKVKEAKEQADRERQARIVAPVEIRRVEYDDSAQHSRHLLAGAIGGVGVLGIAGTALFGTQAQAAKKKVQDNGECDSFHVCNSDGLRHIDEERKFALVADISLGVAVAATVTAVVLWVKAPKPVEKFRVTPTVTSNGAGVQLDGSF